MQRQQFFPKNNFFLMWIGEKGLDDSERIKREAGSKGSRVHRAIEILTAGGEVYHNDVLPDGDGEQEELTADEYETIISFYNFITFLN